MSCHSSCQYEPVKPPHFAFTAFKGTSRLSKRFPKPFGSVHRPVKPRHSLLLRRSKLPIARPQNSPNASLSLSAACTGQSSHRTLLFRRSKVPIASPQTSPNHSPRFWQPPQASQATALCFYGVQRCQLPALKTLQTLPEAFWKLPQASQATALYF